MSEDIRSVDGSSKRSSEISLGFRRPGAETNHPSWRPQLRSALPVGTSDCWEDDQTHPRGGGTGVRRMDTWTLERPAFGCGGKRGWSSRHGFASWEETRRRSVHGARAISVAPTKPQGQRIKY